jgi:uncharacterized Zn finger protein
MEDSRIKKVEYEEVNDDPENYESDSEEETVVLVDDMILAFKEIQDYVDNHYLYIDLTTSKAENDFYRLCCTF